MECKYCEKELDEIELKYYGDSCEECQTEFMRSCSEEEYYNNVIEFDDEETYL